MKISIRSKVILTYLFILLITYVVLGVSFPRLVRSYLIRETQAKLFGQALVMTEMLQQQNLSDALVTRVSLQVVGLVLNAEYAVISSSGKVVLSSQPRYFPRGETVSYESLWRVLRGQVVRDVLTINQRDMIMVAVPLEKVGVRTLEGALVMMTEVRGIKVLSAHLTRVLGLGLVVSALVGLVLALWLGNSVTRPVRQLRNSARKLAACAFDTRVLVKTGDELEELAEAFNSMADDLETYDRSQKSFFQNASHELKTPLMSIRGYAEGIKDGIITGKGMSKAIDIIIAESGRITELVNQLVFLSKLETLEEIYQAKEVDINEVVGDAKERLEGLAAQKDVRIELKSGPPAKVIVDAEKILQVCINLLGNAVRYANNLVNVLVEQRGEQIIISFADDGPGIPEQDLPRIFERFYKGKGGGSGLGLAIAKAIVEKSAGSISAENLPKGGAVFTVILPQTKNIPD